ncbi:nuclear transport factor 2 family protein [Streptomyces sp. NPDC001339]|uniref:nuclear transport factor 2 family protein n=1 Tax=Streptomyces sp. NPDC001339 TaxID=3364563 RepID=UPI00368AA401
MTDTTAVRTQARELFARLLELLETGDIDAWVDLFHEDGVLEFPFPPPGWGTTIKGHEALLSHMKNFPEQLDVRFSDVVIHETTDPELVVAEFTGTGTALATGRPFNQTYVSLIWIKDGKVSRFKDFWNPLVTIESLGGLEAITRIVDN